MSINNNNLLIFSIIHVRFYYSRMETFRLTITIFIFVFSFLLLFRKRKSDMLREQYLGPNRLQRVHNSWRS